MYQWFLNSNTRKKLTIAFGSMIVFLVIIAGVGLSSISDIHSEMNDISKKYLPGINFLLQLDRDLYQSVLAQQTMLTEKSGSTEFEKLKKEHLENIEQVKERWDKFKEAMNGQVEKSLLDSFESNFKAWESETKSIVSRIESDTSGSKDALIAAITASNGNFKETREIVNQLTEATEKKTDVSVVNGEATVNGSERIIKIATVLILLLAYFLTKLVTKSIAEPIKKASDMMVEFGNGVISSRLNLNRADEIGILSHSVDAFANSLSKIVNTLNQVADGNFSDDIKPLSTVDEITPSIHKTLGSLQDLQSETDILINAAIDGKLSTRGNANLFKGGYSKIISGINQTLDAVILPVKEGSAIIEKMSHGDFTSQMTGNYKGDHQILKNSINVMQYRQLPVPQPKYLRVPRKWPPVHRNKVRKPLKSPRQLKK
ncbi:MAG: methyl-accepting chemotaxis protein [Ignavibacteriales bacterium]|nr:methyl-accepting chemotaxis protein [Ignavibacteriales bacterium]